MVWRWIEINKNDASSIKSVHKYESYNDPGFSISKEISSLTGITDDKVKNKSINWDKVKTLLDACQLVVAHNAKFDRKFIEKYIKLKMYGHAHKMILTGKIKAFLKTA